MGPSGMEEKEMANMPSFFLLYIFYIMNTQPNILERCYIRQVFFALWFLYREICMLLFGQPQALGSNNNKKYKKYKKYKKKHWPVIR